MNDPTTHPILPTRELLPDRGRIWRELCAGLQDLAWMVLMILCGSVAVVAIHDWIDVLAGR
jgi:hypothetical protein